MGGALRFNTGGGPVVIAASDESFRPRVGPRQRRAIAALRTDGGTAFCLDVAPWAIRPELERLLELLRRDRPADVEAQERKEGIVVELPMPRRRWHGQAGLGFDSESSSASDDPWRHQWGPDVPAPLARVTVDGRQSQHLTFWIEDRCHARLDERTDPDTGEVIWRCRLEAKARELYADGLAVWLERWLGLWSWLLTGHWASPGTGEFASIGWRTTQWHVNADFVFLDFDSQDTRHFVRLRKFSEHGRTKEEIEWEGVEAAGSSACPWLETLTIGRKSSDTQVCIYRKGEQLRSAKKVEPRASMYAPLWEANGWDPDLDGDPTRVEIRLRKKGLQQRHRGRDLDFRDPDLLLNRWAVRTVWGGVMERRRLVLPGWTRVVNAQTDPRWTVVQEVGLPAPDLRQVPRKVREMTREERLAKDLRDLTLGAARLASRHGVGIRAWREIGDVLAVVGRELQVDGAPAVLAALPRAPDLVAASKRAAVTSQFFEDQAREAMAVFVERLDSARGKKVPRVGVFDLASGRD